MVIRYYICKKCNETFRSVDGLFKGRNNYNKCRLCRSNIKKNDVKEIDYTKFKELRGVTDATRD